MPLFKKNSAGDPAKPSNGDPPPSAPPGNGDPPAAEYVSKADFDAMKENFETVNKTLQEVNLRIQGFASPQPAQPSAPPGPTETEKLQSQLREKQAELSRLNKQFEDAYSSAQPVGDIMAKKDAISAEISEIRSELKWRPRLDALEQTGGQALEQLTDTVTRGQMPYLSDPDVKRTYEETMKQIPQQYRSDMRVRKQAYDAAVGANHEKLFEARLQEAARKAADDPPGGTQEPGAAGSGRQHSSGGGPSIPDPKEVLSSDNLAAIRASGKTVESYYKSLGYEGWADFYEKTGREFFEEGENV
jgi:hypothetical protein